MGDEKLICYDNLKYQKKKKLGEFWCINSINAKISYSLQKSSMHLVGYEGCALLQTVGAWSKCPLNILSIN